MGRTQFPQIRSELELDSILKSLHNNLSQGRGFDDISIFKAYRKNNRYLRKNTRGSGLFSNFLGGLSRKVLPFLKNYILPIAKQFGKDIYSDVTSGNSSVKKSVKKRGLQSLANLANKLSEGEGIKRASNRKIRVKRKKLLKKRVMNAKKKLKKIRKNRKKITRARGARVRKSSIKKRYSASKKRPSKSHRYVKRLSKKNLSSKSKCNSSVKDIFNL